MTNEQTARIVVDFDDDPRCFGCGDYQSYCNDIGCADILQRHDSGDHVGCDILVCAEADVDAYNRGVING